MWNDSIMIFVSAIPTAVHQSLDSVILIGTDKEGYGVHSSVVHKRGMVSAMFGAWYIAYRKNDISKQAACKSVSFLLLILLSSQKMLPKWCCMTGVENSSDNRATVSGQFENFLVYFVTNYCHIFSPIIYTLTKMTSINVYNQGVSPMDELKIWFGK